jgi:osmotically-inducible protein OsmY
MKLNVITLLLAPVLAAGCIHSHTVAYYPDKTVVTPTSHRTVARVYSDAGPGGVASASDMALARSIQEMLATDPAMNAAARMVDIEVKDGRVILRGTIPSDRESYELQERLARYPGVKSVKNHLHVSVP